MSEIKFDEWCDVPAEWCGAENTVVVHTAIVTSDGSMVESMLGSILYRAGNGQVHLFGAINSPVKVFIRTYCNPDIPDLPEPAWEVETPVGTFTQFGDGSLSWGGGLLLSGIRMGVDTFFIELLENYKEGQQTACAAPTPPPQPEPVEKPAENLPLTGLEWRPMWTYDGEFPVALFDGVYVTCLVTQPTRRSGTYTKWAHVNLPDLSRNVTNACQTSGNES